jgi:hypothetical protein
MATAIATHHPLWQIAIPVLLVVFTVAGSWAAAAASDRRERERVRRDV